MGSWIDVMAWTMLACCALVAAVALYDGFRLNAQRHPPRRVEGSVPVTVDEALRHAYIVRDEIGSVGFAQIHGWAADLGVLARHVPPPMLSGASTVDTVLSIIERTERENARRERRRNPQTVEDFTMNMAEDWAATTALMPRIGEEDGMRTERVWR